MQQDQLVDYFSNSAGYAELYQEYSPEGFFFIGRLKIVRELIGDYGRKRVLDVGCGPCMTIPLMCEEYEYYGLDLSKQMLNECRKRFEYFRPINLILANMGNLPIEDTSFDIVLCLGALEYIPNAKAAVRELSRITNDNGIVIISMLNKYSPYRSWYHHIYRSNILTSIRRRLGRPIPNEPVLNLLSLKQLQSLFASAQLSAIDVVYFDFKLWLAPLDRFFPRLTVYTARKLEFLGRSRLRNLGSGFIVKARKVCKAT